MATVLEELKAELTRAEARLGSDSFSVKSLREQIRIAENFTNATSQDLYLIGRRGRTPKKS